MMPFLKLNLWRWLFLICLIGCNNDDQGDCANVTLNRERLINPIGAIEISDVELQGDCVEVTFVVMDGCNTSSPGVELFYDDGYLESLPPLKRLQLSYNEPSSCGETYPRTATFDISILRHPDHDELRIQIFGWDGELQYKY